MDRGSAANRKHLAPKAPINVQIEDPVEDDGDRFGSALSRSSGALQLNLSRGSSIRLTRPRSSNARPAAAQYAERLLHPPPPCSPSTGPRAFLFCCVDRYYYSI